MGRVIEKIACQNCRSLGGDLRNDNQVIYEDGSSFCFACRTVNRGQMGVTRQVVQAEAAQNEFLDGNYHDLYSRGISSTTTHQCNYKTGFLGNNEVQIAEWITKDGENIQGQKVRTLDKKFFWIRRPDPLFMYNLYNSNHDYSKPIIITEGEIDCLSCQEVGFQACSLIDGCSSARRDIERDLPELLKYSEIILFFDNDEPGQKAFQECKDLIPVEKLRFIDEYYGFKDANEMLLARKDKQLLIDVLNTRVVEQTPPGLLYGNQIDVESLKNTSIKSIPLPWPELNESMNGIEYGCLYLFLAGTSVGKSSVLREMVYYYRNNFPNLKIANFFLEENEEVTPLAYVALHNNIPLGELRRSRGLLSDEKWNEAKDSLLNTENLLFINKSFKKDTETMLDMIRYLVTVKKFDLIIIDHISYLIGRSGVSSHGERKDVDTFLYQLQDLVQSLGCIVVAVSHVNESDSGKRWDQGEVPHLYSGRSSRVLAQVPDGIVGLARSMTNKLTCDELKLYNLKNRWFSKLGACDTLDYISTSGRLQVRPKPKTATELFEGEDDKKD